MKIARFLIALAVAVMGVASVQAQTAAEVKASVAKMSAAKAPCNQGPESFKSFIEKFNTDQAFIDERLAVTPEQKEKFASILTPGNFEAKAPFAKDGDEYYQMWGEVQWGKVYLDCGWVDSYVTHTFEFIRKDGKWYLGKVVPGE